MSLGKKGYAHDVLLEWWWMRCTCYLNVCSAYEHIRQAYQSDLFSIFAPDVPVGEAARADPALVKRFMDSDPAWKLARYVFECMEHRREHGRAVMSSEESCGSSSVEDSGLWTEEVDEELEYISLMDDHDDLEVLPLEPMLAASRAAPPFGEGAILKCNVM